MSLLHTVAPHRRDKATDLRVPVVLPLVQVRFDDQGMLDVTVDREPYETDDPLTRDDLHRALDEIIGDLASPVRVEIREPGDSVFTDIITPGPRRDDHPQSTLTTSAFPSPGEVAGGGFLPDEEVAVAVVVAHQVANPDGTARLRLPPALLAGRPGAVALLGRTSGVIAVSGGVT